MNIQKFPVLRLFLTFFLVFTISFSGFADTNSVVRPDPYDEITLLEAIPLLSRKYNVYFTYDMQLVAKVKVQYDPNHKSTIEQELTQILSTTIFQFKIFNKQFIILYKQDEEGIESIKEMLKHFEILIADNEAKLKKEEETIEQNEITDIEETQDIDE